MKIRTGFVTNSSSTSFCIVGVRTNDLREKIEERIDELIALYETKVKKKIDRDDVLDDWSYFLAEVFPDITIHRDYESDYAYVGLDITEMKDTETLGDFKKRVAQMLKDVGLTTASVGIIAETIGN